MNADLIDPSAYCHDLEAYLCRKNDGHLIRIVGPAFDQVCGWATRGIPLKVACRGIDRYFERYYAKGPRRRPVRIEFCEADVLDVFDEWKRAVGVPMAADTTAGEDGARRGPTLPAHLDRVIARLTTTRGGMAASLAAFLEAMTRELDALRFAAKSARGDARQQMIERLSELDSALIAAARAACDAGTLDQLQVEAETELAPFRPRMMAADYEQARQAAVDKLLRERLRLPTVGYEA